MCVYVFTVVHKVRQMERLACEAHDALAQCIEEEVARRTHQSKEVRGHWRSQYRNLVGTHSQVLGMGVALLVKI